MTTADHSPRALLTLQVQRLLRVVWPFLLIIVLLVALAGYGIELLSDGRAVVGGESSWSKGQKDAVLALGRYSRSCSVQDWRDYERAIAVPLGDREARLALSGVPPDFERAVPGFAKGRIHPDDIEGVSELFVHFRNVGLIRQAVDIWAAGDVLIEQLQQAATALQADVASHCAEAEARQPLLARIEALNAQLTPLEERFSETLGEANRSVRVILFASMATAACLLACIGIWLSYRIVQRNLEVERELKTSEDRYQRAVTGSDIGLWELMAKAGEMYLSPSFKQLLGHPADALLSTRADDVVGWVHPDERPAVRATLDRHVVQAERFAVECRMRMQSGAYRWVRIAGRASRDSQRRMRVVGSIQDITAQKELEDRLHAEKERAQVTLRSIGDGVVTTDAQGRIDYLNPAAQQLTGWTLAEAQGQRVGDVIDIVDERSGARLAWPSEGEFERLADADVHEQAVLVARDGRRIAVDESMALIRGADGRGVGVVAALRDVSDERQRAAVLSYEASHDALTGLINRREFGRRLSQALQQAVDEDRHHTLMYLDLDQFKVVNDTCGHHAGDALLVQLAELMKRNLREGDTLARVGGDEFCAILGNCRVEAGTRVAEQLREAVAGFVFAAGGQSFRSGISIGLVEIGAGGMTMNEALSAADAACRLAKEKGRNRIQAYSPQDDEIAARRGEMTWLGRIQAAIAEQRFVLHAQEIVPVRDLGARGRHVELLVRMLDDQGRLVPPMAFIPAAERYGLMPAIDRWVIGAAFATLAGWRRQRVGGVPVRSAINVSGASIADESFPAFLREQFARHDLPHGSICFEITETAAISHLGRAAAVVREFRALGCSFALDDFGTGMSSFAYLKHLPVDFLKIDGSFVKQIATDPIDRAMVKAIHEVGRTLGMQTIAEYAENDEVLAVLAELGVDHAQGWGVGRPTPFEPSGAALTLHT